MTPLEQSRGVFHFNLKETFMLAVTDPRVIVDADLRDLLQLRFDQVCDGEDYDPDIHSQFFLVERLTGR